MEREYRGRNCLLSSIAVLAVFFYATATPLQKKAAQNTPLNLTIEHSNKFPLQIVLATVADISVPTQRTNDLTAHLVNPNIVLKNNSDHTLSIYVLEFRKAGLEPFYLTRTVGLGPKAMDSIKTNSPNTFLYSAGEARVTGTGDTWKVRIAAVRFKDGNVVTLHGWPSSPREPLRGGQVLEGNLIKRVEPIYPEEAKRLGIQGQVVMNVTIDEQGNVTDVKVRKGHPLLNDAALEAVKQWKYNPTFLNGRPVPVIATVHLDFEIK
jgi:TonB family protein